jgi:predicted regulator of Ras-like GTPase activity (Roadblock/LC7/MglB family)
VAYPAVAAVPLAQLLDELVDRVAVAAHAVVLSPDGLLLAASREVDHKLAEQISSVVAGLQALAIAAGQHSGSGPVRQVIVQMWRAFLFVTATRGNAILAVLFPGNTDVGTVAYEVAFFAGQAHRHLPVSLEPASAR